MARSKYFLHVRAFEHFGMAVADAIALGSVPVVHDSGGLRELVPDHRLRFDALSEAVERFRAVDSDPTLRSTLRARLEEVRQDMLKESLESTLERMVGR
jgi:glycosyltransferase involved in cell wall biosynthesis